MWRMKITKENILLTPQTWWFSLERVIKRLMLRCEVLMAEWINLIHIVAQILSEIPTPHMHNTHTILSTNYLPLGTLSIVYFQKSFLTRWQQTVEADLGDEGVGEGERGLGTSYIVPHILVRTLPQLRAAQNSRTEHGVSPLLKGRPFLKSALSMRAFPK